MTKEEIKGYLISKNRRIDKDTLEYYANYFYVLSNNPYIMGDKNIYKLMDNALVYAKKLVFYDKDSPVYERLGPDCKGLRDPKTKIIYVRDDLGKVLKEITIYHELHHATQTNPQNDEVGINQEFNYGRMIMEAQTQYFAEKVYEATHEMTFGEKEIPSEELRMKPGGTVVSALHNYEMYDSFLSKLAILLEVPKDYFVEINFLYKNNEGMYKLRNLYEKQQAKYHYPYKFEDFMYGLDYIYCVDLCAYTENPAKEVLLSGQPTKEQYGIHRNRGDRLSLDQEMAFINDLDRKYLLSLLDSNGNWQEYSKYVIDNSIREQLFQLLNTDESNQSIGTK